MPRPTAQGTEPVVGRGRRAPHVPVQPLVSLLTAAPELRRCMACMTLRIATAAGIVLWHADAINPRHDCAGAEAPGIPVCAHCWGPLTVSTGTLADGSRVCRTDTAPGAEGAPDCYRLVTVDGETLGARRAA